jgi:AAA+ superfamily predicted ATPase
MAETDPTVRALREALEHSPDNAPLRRHLAQTLTDLGRHADAIEELRHVLRIADDDRARLELARAYLAAGQPSHAAVLLELLVQRDPPVGEAFRLMARVHLAEGRADEAARAYRRAVEADPALADPGLAAKLGLYRAGAEDEQEAAAAEPPAADRGEPRGRVPLEGGGGELGDAEGLVSAGDFEKPKIRFADVGGMDAVKEEIAIKVIQPLAHPELFEAYGKKVGGGLLLYGPPGCGKTHLARATAGEVQARFLSVGLHQVLDMWIGESEKHLHALFDAARRNAPCVLFFDEVDALAAKRTDMRWASGRHVINQFLSELDGAQASNDGVLVLAATNAPWHMDAAFRRPGRFDRVLFVPPPDRDARESILRVHLEQRPIAPGIQLGKVAAKTEGFSGADLKGLVDLAVEEKLREAMKRGAPAPIGEKDLLAAAKRMRPSTKEWFAAAKNHVLFGNEGGIYDDLARYMGI